jgi:pimeloyl-ACP methyl ester carboxylesterase
MIRTRSARRAAVALAVVALGLPLVAANWQQEFVQGIKSKDSNVRRRAVSGVDADSPAGLKALLSVVAEQDPSSHDWFIRAEAIDRLGSVYEPRARKAFDGYLKKALKKLRTPQLDSAMIEAAGMIADPTYVELLGPVLAHKRLTPPVLYATVRALGKIGDLSAVGPIMAAWEKFQDPRDYRLDVVAAAALSEITEQEFGRSFQPWKAFWDANGEGYVKPSDGGSTGAGETGAEEDGGAKKKEEKEQITTVARDTLGTDLEFTTTGRDGAVPLLVIHDDSWTPNYFDPYLSCLDDVFKIYYVELPAVSKLKIKKRNIGGFPFYPYDELCDAFEAARKELKIEKFALLAHGFSTMIAQRYLSKYPGNVSHAIMVGTFPGDDAYGNMMDVLRAKASSRKDKELERAVDFHFITDEKTFTRFYDPKDDEELEALERKFFSIMFADPQDPEIAKIWQRSAKPTSRSLKLNEAEQSQSPPFDVMREKRPPVPVLVISGQKAIWFGPADGKRVAANYPVSQHVVLKDAANMPWFDDPGGFEGAVRSFMKQYGGE